MRSVTSPMPLNIIPLDGSVQIAQNARTCSFTVRVGYGVYASRSGASYTECIL